MIRSLFKLLLTFVISVTYSDSYSQCNQVYSVSTEKKVVGLGIDVDRYNPDLLKLAQWLNHQDIQATFFLSGHPIMTMGDAQQKSSLHNMIREVGKVRGRFEIGTRSFGGRDLTNVAQNSYSNFPSYQSLTQYQKLIFELDQSWGTIRQAIAQSGKEIETVNLLRPPYGRSNSRVESAAMRRQHTLVFSDLNADDYYQMNQNSIASMVARLQSLLRPGSLIKISSSNPNFEALTKSIVQAFSRQGYQFAKVSQLLTMGGCQVTGDSGAITPPIHPSPTPIPPTKPEINLSQTPWFIKVGSFNSVQGLSARLSLISPFLGTGVQAFTQKSGTFTRLYLGGSFRQRSDAEPLLRKVVKKVKDAFIKKLDPDELGQLKLQ